MRNNKIIGDFSSCITETKGSLDVINKGIGQFLNNPERLETIIPHKLGEELDLLQAMYSANYPMNIIKEEFEKLAEFYVSYSEYFINSGYSTVARFIAFSILLDASSDRIFSMYSKLSNSEYTDKFLGFLLSYFIPSIDFESKSFSFPSYYNELLELSNSVEIKDYLGNKWYENQKDESWYDVHLNSDKSLYSGYWAWDVAAIAKIKGIDVGSLNNVDYFPYDVFLQ